MTFAKFMAGSIGRGVRSLTGLILIALALTSLEGVAAALLIVVGLVFVAVGVFNICLLAPLFGAPLSGKDVLAS